MTTLLDKETQEAPPLPDITRDRICVIWGGSIIPQHEHFVRLVDGAMATCVLVPENEWPLSAEDAERYPRERTVNVLHEMAIGTVAELVEDFRVKLTKAFDAITYKQPDGTFHEIPTFGEASLRRQNVLLRLARHDKFESPVP